MPNQVYILLTGLPRSSCRRQEPTAPSAVTQVTYANLGRLATASTDRALGASMSGADCRLLVHRCFVRFLALDYITEVSVLLLERFCGLA